MPLGYEPTRAYCLVFPVQFFRSFLFLGCSCCSGYAVIEVW